MSLALEEAKFAFKKGEVPVGSIVVDHNDTIIGRGHNLVIQNNDIMFHAEIIAIQQAFKIKGLKLNGCKIYVTLEPCLMCMGAIIKSQISELYFSTFSPVDGALSNHIVDELFYQNIKISHSILKDKSQKILGKFFAQRREES